MTLSTRCDVAWHGWHQNCARRFGEELHNKTPVLMLIRHRDTILDKVTGFDSGADDYFGLAFFARRIRIPY